MPARLRPIVGKREIKISLGTTDRTVAHIRCLEELAIIARAWSGIEPAVIAGGADPFAGKSSAGRPGALPDVAQSAAPAAQPVMPAAAAVAAAARLPLRSLFATYAKEAQLAPSTVKRWSPVLDRLIGHLGHDDAAAISRADVVAWKDVLLDGGMKNITVRDVYLASAKAMFQFAVDQGQLAENPAAEVKVRVKKKVKEREKGFDADEAHTILAATLRRFDERISEEMKAARRWVPWICALTGARVNEITPLRPRDFVKRDGIWMIRIGGANSKSRSYREVPLHGQLIETGLLDYAKSRGARPLFYDPDRSRGGKDSSPHHKKVAERLAEWVRTLGIDAGVAPNHGWRHRFSSVARFVGMPEDVRNIIQGHAGTKCADDYGDTWPLVALREIEKLPRYAV